MNTIKSCLVVVLLASFTVADPWWKSFFGIKSKTTPPPSKQFRTTNTLVAQGKIAGYKHDIETMNKGIEKRLDKFKMRTQLVYLESVHNISTLVDVLEKKKPDNRCLTPLLHNLIDLKINTLRDVKACVETGYREGSIALENYKRDTTPHQADINRYIREIEKCNITKCSQRIVELHLQSLQSIIAKWYSNHARYAIEFSRLTSNTSSCIDISLTRAESNIFVIERNAGCPLDW